MRNRIAKPLHFYGDLQRHSRALWAAVGGYTKTHDSLYEKGLGQHRGNYGREISRISDQIRVTSLAFGDGLLE